MKKQLCLLVALALSLTAVSCSKIKARMEIRQANDLYVQEKYAEALEHYEEARNIDPTFPELDRLIGYSSIGLYEPENKTPDNEKHADRAILELQRYLKKRPSDVSARDALIGVFLNADRIGQAIDFFKGYLRENPADLDAVKSIATLYAKEGDFNESLNWYEKITLLDAKNPEAFYTYGVVCYEKIAKNPPADPAEKLAIVEKGKAALERSLQLKPDYFDSLVYLNLLYRQQANIEIDPEKQLELIARADELRGRAMEIARARKAGK